MQKFLQFGHLIGRNSRSLTCNFALISFPLGILLQTNKAPEWVSLPNLPEARLSHRCIVTTEGDSKVEKNIIFISKKNHLILHFNLISKGDLGDWWLYKNF
jgi:hypothetical protein